MSSFDVTFQLVDSPVDKSESGGSVAGDGLVGVFRDFPFAKEIARAKEGATFPTIMFRRLSDGEEVSVWTIDDKQFDLCFVKNGKKSFLNNRSKDQVEEILIRFRTESVDAIRPPSLWRKLFG
ncbi:MAG: hypothetical protein Q8M02_01050 [Candidatus Didemnitutus sp.]|nr:hypothetical protein [Candidatus Didemnitutus sp.]